MRGRRPLVFSLIGDDEEWRRLQDCLRASLQQLVVICQMHFFLALQPASLTAFRWLEEIDFLLSQGLNESRGLVHVEYTH